MSLNSITVGGRLVRDVELRQTPAGVSVASFTIACDRDIKNKATGERETDFIDIVAWRSTADFAARFFSKGRVAIVKGRLQIRNWEDQSGNKRRTAEIVADNIYFGDSNPNAQGGTRPNVPFDGYRDEEYQEILEDDTELPF